MAVVISVSAISWCVSIVIGRTFITMLTTLGHIERAAKLNPNAPAGEQSRILVDNRHETASEEAGR